MTGREVEPLPLPARCFRCGELVLETDKRLYYPGIDQPLHQACYIRPLIGSVAHIEKRCSCFVPGAEETDDPSLTRRQAAEASLAALERLRPADIVNRPWWHSWCDGDDELGRTEGAADE